jgi:predicted HTH transcriptional regulator
VNDKVNDKVNVKDEQIKAICKLLSAYPKTTYPEISEKLKIGYVTVSKRIKELKENGVLFRQGSKKTGEWVYDEERYREHYK